MTKKFINSIRNSSFLSTIKNISYDDAKKSNVSYSKDYLKKISKSFYPLTNIINKYNIKTFKSVKLKILNLKNSISSLNNRLLKLNQLKDDKKSNLYPSANFKYKIVHNEKIDPDKYVKIINWNNSIDFEYFESYQYSLLTNGVKNVIK